MTLRSLIQILCDFPGCPNVSHSRPIDPGDDLSDGRVVRQKVAPFFEEGWELGSDDDPRTFCELHRGGTGRKANAPAPKAGAKL